MKRRMIIATMYFLTGSLLVNCGSREVTQSNKVKTTDFYYAFNVSYDAQTERLTHIAEFRHNDRWGDAIELVEPAKIAVNDQSMDGIDARNFNSALTLLLPIPFLFVNGTGYFYTLNKNNVTALPPQHEFNFTNQKGENQTFTVKSSGAAKPISLKAGQIIKRTEGFAVVTSEIRNDRDISIDCALRTSDDAQTSFVRTVHAKLIGKNQTCTYRMEDLKDAPTGELTLTVTRSIRKKLKGGNGVSSFSYIGKSLNVILAD